MIRVLIKAAIVFIGISIALYHTISNTPFSAPVVTSRSPISSTTIIDGKSPSSNEESTVATQAPDKQIYSSVEDFIHKQEIIRVYAPAVGGYGHISATTNLMDHLRQDLGFQGVFEVIYPSFDFDKVAVLFDLPANAKGSVYEDKKNKVKFIPLEEQIRRFKDNNMEPEVPLGISAAANDDYPPCMWLSGISLSVNDAAMCTNVAKLLNVAMYASMTHDPYEDSITQSGNEFLLKNDDNNRYLLDKSNTFFISPTTNLDQVHSYLIGHQNIISKQPALNAFIHGMENQDFNVMPVYGRTIVEINAIFNMLQIIIGARYAQIKETKLNDKPLVIAVFHDYESEAHMLDLHINHFPYSYTKNAIDSLSLNQPFYFSTARLSNPNTIGLLKGLKNDHNRKIILLSMGKLPKIIFDGLFTYNANNIWPPIREGYSTLSSLILTGKPHFRCGNNHPMIAAFGFDNWDLGYRLMQDSSLKAQFQAFYKLTAAFCDGEETWKNNSELYKQLGEFIIDAHDTTSTLSQYFQTLKSEASKPENDRARYMLNKVVKYFNNNGDRSTLMNYRIIALPKWPR